MRHLSQASTSDNGFFIYYTPVVLHRFFSLAFVPTVLGTSATEMPFLVTSVTLNFAHISRSSSSSSSLHKPPTRCIPSLIGVAPHGAGIYFFTSGYPSPGSSC